MVIKCVRFCPRVAHFLTRIGDGPALWVIGASVEFDKLDRVTNLNGWRMASQTHFRACAVLHFTKHHVYARTWALVITLFHQHFWRECHAFPWGTRGKFPRLVFTAPCELGGDF